MVCPEHRRVFRNAGWKKEGKNYLMMSVASGSDIIVGAKGIAEDAEKFENKIISKFRDDGLHITSTGSKAGMFSAIISGWVASGEKGVSLYHKEFKKGDTHEQHNHVRSNCRACSGRTTNSAKVGYTKDATIGL